jgi:hypothetical protein
MCSSVLQHHGGAANLKYKYSCPNMTLLQRALATSQHPATLTLTLHHLRSPVAIVRLHRQNTEHARVCKKQNQSQMARTVKKKAQSGQNQSTLVWLTKKEVLLLLPVLLLLYFSPVLLLLYFSPGIHYYCTSHLAFTILPSATSLSRSNGASGAQSSAVCSAASTSPLILTCSCPGL